ncbi:Dynein heavy chain 5 [Blattella germanica]|nr:Dynein heavy chain 5 [Blattella germanica]
MPGFMLYITTKLPNPAYSPEISAKTSIIDFTVTIQGLEEQLLGRVILMEKSDLEAERVALFESVMKNQRSMKELESNLLCRLTSTQKLTSLSTKSSLTEERIKNILSYLTYEVWAFTLRSLYERHKVLFTLMLAMKIDCHKGLISHDEFSAFIKGNEKEWRVWYEKERPEEEVIPCGYNASLDVFRKLLLIRSWSPDRTLSQARKYIMALKSVSMGQGQEMAARRLISDSMAGGGWVLLQNIHLSLPFCNEAMDALVETENVHETFRLWMTTEVHTQFPIALLQMAIKFTNEPPQGIRASLKRTYQNITQDTLDYSAQPQWPPLLYAVAFLHTVVQERRKFGPLGWNIPYEFNQADFAASVQFVQNHLDDMDPKKGISWPTVCYMLGEVQYGGRVTDDFDKRLLTTFTHVWFCDVLLRPGFEFYKNYKVPMTKNIQDYVDYINGLPPTDTPEVFGLHSNADITYQINTAKGILDTILSVQPKEGGGGGGETREKALQRMGALLPMNIFLRQEIDRIQRVIKTVHSTLCNLKLAIDGTIVMSQGLRCSLDAMYDARIPDSWQKVSWESATLGFWYTELLERDAQFRRWISNGRPNVFWMTGFFNPQGFLTAMRQNLITRHSKEDLTDSPPEGVYVHGLFLEGASLDRRSGKLIESKPKVLYEQMPVIYIYAINTTAGKDSRLYECPIYRKPQRTDQKYIGSIDFETDNNPRHWTLRGVALLCDIK